MATMTLVDVLCGSAGPQPAVTDPTGTVDFVALCNASDAVAAALAARGVAPGDRVAAVLPDGAAFLAAFMGTAVTRATFAPLPGENDLQARLTRLAPRLLLASAEPSQRVRVAAAAAGVPVVTLRFDAGGAALVDGEPVYDAHGRLADADDVALLAADGATYTHGALVDAITAAAARGTSTHGGSLAEAPGLIAALAVLHTGGHLTIEPARAAAAA